MKRTTVLLALLLAVPIGAQAMLGTVTAGDAAIGCVAAQQLAAENQELYRRAYGPGGKVVDPVASELLSWRLRHGPGLKAPCEGGGR